VTHETPAIRASDADRERAVERLRTHVVDGRLTLEELAERVDRAYAARTVDELEELTRDMPELDAPRPSPRRASRRLISILGGVERRGRFRLAADTVAVAVLGGIDLDLREAEIESAESTLTIYTVLGGVDISVPDGVDVDVQGLSILGGKNVRTGRRPGAPGAPRLTIRAYTFLGGLSVKARPRA
jgi:Domain of unknown function (DUF1707)/Cell wall-active antibiotics response 4TMS YvqF